METPVQARRTPPWWSWPYGWPTAAMLALPLVAVPAVFFVVWYLPPPAEGERMQRTLSLAGTFGLLWALAFLLFFRRMHAAVSHLREAVERVAAGDLGPMRHAQMPAPFLSDLQGALADMVGRLQDVRLAARSA
jgi:HAMP domain-containing protein